MEETELMLSTQVKTAFANVLKGYGMCKTEAGREYYRCELARVAKAAERVDPGFYAILVEQGYVVDRALEMGTPAESISFSDRFIVACNTGDTEQLLELQEQDQDLYLEQLERLLQQFAARINQLRVDGGNVIDELVLRGNMRRKIELIPGINLGAPRTRVQIEAERNQADARIQFQRSLSIPAEAVEVKHFGLNDLTTDIISGLSPRELQLYMNQIFDGEGFIPGELNRAFNTGLFTEEEIAVARKFLSGFVERVKVGGKPTGFSVGAKA
ncbi:MAG: hypothetical protein PHS44_00340 [Candidatus Dojkabacteria bacterium]|nr:hypothetical protein [Candidatus Dojkabacteria bacterium]